MLENSFVATNVGYDYSCIFQVDYDGNLCKLLSFCAPWNYGFTVNPSKNKFVLTDEHQQIYCLELKDIQK